MRNFHHFTGEAAVETELRRDRLTAGQAIFRAVPIGRGKYRLDEYTVTKIMKTRVVIKAATTIPTAPEAWLIVTNREFSERMNGRVTGRHDAMTQWDKAWLLITADDPYLPEFRETSVEG